MAGEKPGWNEVCKNSLRIPDAGVVGRIVGGRQGLESLEHNESGANSVYTHNDSPRRNPPPET